MSFQDEINKLNDKQKQVVNHINGPLMVLAGAGSGKTKALTMRISNLIKNHNILSQNILAITFTKKAAREMKYRVDSLLEDQENYSFISTFHRFCLYILKNQINYTDLKKNFTIYDGSESKAIIKTLLNKLFEDDPYYKNDKRYSVNSIKSFIEKIQNQGILSEEEKKEWKKKEFYFLYEEYEAELIKSNAVDFNNIINQVLYIFHKNNHVLEFYADKYKYLLIDEYQDTNRAQFQLIKFFSNFNNNICVIGDEDQSIYSFRGADINNILDFETLFTEYDLIKLEENYRSTKNILEAANSVVSNNIYRKGKVLFTNNQKGERINLKSFYNDKEESSFIANEIYNLLNYKKVNGSDIAIMFRNNAQSRSIEEALRKNNISYHFTGGMKFYERKEIKDALSYLKVVLNPEDSYSLLRVINTPSRGIGKTTINKITTLSNHYNISMWDTINNHLSEIKLSKKALNSIKSFVNFINYAMSMIKPGNTLNLFNHIMKASDYEKVLKESSSYEDLARYDNIQEFKNALFESDRDMLDLNDLLDNLLLDGIDEETPNTIQLLTIHASKGLEFKNVYLIGLEDNVFPSPRSLKEEDLKIGIEEERRLFYVAITRAEESLTITYAKRRFMHGTVQETIPSRFLRELPKENIDTD